VAVEADIQSLTKDADKFADEAVKQHKLTLLSKSNAYAPCIQTKN